VLHHLQLTLPRIERDEARARIATKIAARQVCFQRSVRRTQVAPLRRGAFAKRDLELTIASSFLRISIDDFQLKPVPTLRSERVSFFLSDDERSTRAGTRRLD
jgi:hypothetical protein